VALTIGRYYIRTRVHGGLLSDDLTHGIALISLIAFDALETINFPLETKIAAFGAGTGPEPSNSQMDLYFRTVVAAQLAFWPTIYGVKLSFLLLYRHIFHVSQPFMIAWRIVLGYIVVTFFASFLTAFWFCGSPSELFVMTSCLSPQAAKNVNTYSKALVALNVLGDLAIMALPLSIVKSLHIKRSQKFGLACVFLLGFVTIFCDIARILVGGDGNGLKLAPLWDVLEPSLGVIISTLPTYRGLLLSSKQRRASLYRNVGPSRSLGTFGSKNGQSHELSRFAGVVSRTTAESTASDEEHLNGSIRIVDDAVLRDIDEPSKVKFEATYSKPAVL